MMLQQWDWHSRGDLYVTGQHVGQPECAVCSSYLVRLNKVDKRLCHGQSADRAEVEAVHIVPEVDLVVPAMEGRL